ncbi:MAG: alpha amylase C-terminal domain-containing protein, partial [Actinomycetota bacterium]|nr:alpha amylase C-terminal domain-containing protein [Actinomycetota bacterium]
TTRGLIGQHVNVYHLNDDDNVIAFHRWDRGGPRDDVVVVINVAHRSYDNYRIGFPRRGEWRVRFNSDWLGYGEDLGNHLGYDTVAEDSPSDTMAQSGNVGIGPYSAVVYSQDE